MNLHLYVLLMNLISSSTANGVVHRTVEAVPSPMVFGRIGGRLPILHPRMEVALYAPVGRMRMQEDASR